MFEAFSAITTNDSVVVLVQFGEGFLEQRHPPSAIFGLLGVKYIDLVAPRLNWKSVVNIDVDPFTFNVKLKSENSVFTVLLICSDALNSVWLFSN